MPQKPPEERGEGQSEPHSWVKPQPKQANGVVGRGDHRTILWRLESRWMRSKKVFDFLSNPQLILEKQKAYTVYTVESPKAEKLETTGPTGRGEERKTESKEDRLKHYLRSGGIPQSPSRV